LAKEDWEVFIRSQLPTGLSKEETLRELKLIRDSMTQQGSMEGMRVALDSSLEDALALLQVPTLVMHPRDYVTLRSSESMKLAASISGARMVMTDGYDIFDDAGQGIQAIETFLEELPSEQQSESAAVVGQNRLSSREHEVLRLIARGLSNQQMADELVISVRTVERHINHIYEKIGVHNRAQAAAYAVSHRSVAR
jgi:DNA-binding CsgD family transcriptional regulator